MNALAGSEWYLMMALLSRMALMFLALAPLSKTVAAERVTIAHWGNERILIYLPVYVAFEEGFCERNGLEVQFKYSGNDDQVFAAVLRGDAQFGLSDPTFTAISREKGGTGRVVATVVGKVANWGVAEKGRFKETLSIEQLNGLRVSSFPEPSTTFTILSEIKKKYSLDQMKIVPMAFGTELAALQAGQVDLAVMLEPQTSIAEAAGYEAVWSVANYYGPFMLTGITTTDAYIDKRPEVVSAVVQSLQQALQAMHEKPDIAIRVARKSFPTLDASVVEAATRRMLQDETIPRTVVIAQDAWKRTIASRVAVGDIHNAELAAAALDNRFAVKAATLPQPHGTEAPRDSEEIKVPVENPWTWDRALGVISDILSIALAIGAAVVYLKWRTKHRLFEGLSEDEKAVGSDILAFFKARQTHQLLRLDVNGHLLKCGHPGPVIEAALDRFAKLGALHRRKSDGEEQIELKTTLPDLQPNLEKLLSKW